MPPEGVVLTAAAMSRLLQILQRVEMLSLMGWTWASVIVVSISQGKHGIKHILRAGSVHRVCGEHHLNEVKKFLGAVLWNPDSPAIGCPWVFSGANLHRRMSRRTF